MEQQHHQPNLNEKESSLNDNDLSALVCPSLEVQERTLPRIIGVHHIAANINATLAVLDTLPVPSKVGLEFNPEAPELERWLGFPCGSTDGFFRRVAEHAEGLGHTVVWLERPSSFISPLEKRLMIEVHAIKSLLKEDETLTRDERDILFRRLDVLHKIELRRVHLHAGWRSEIMAKYIEREEWSPDDVVIVGASHAVDLERHLGEPMEMLIMEGGRGSFLDRLTTRAANTVIQKGYDRELFVRRFLDKQLKKGLESVRDHLHNEGSK